MLLGNIEIQTER